MSAQPHIATREYFPSIGRIPFERRGSGNPLAIKVHDACKRIGGKTMHRHAYFEGAAARARVSGNSAMPSAASSSSTRQ